MVAKEATKLAEILWDYLHMGQTPKKSDCVLVLGSHDLRVAKRGAELYLEGFAPMIIFSGGFGNYTKLVWKRPEAEKFAAVARRMGVPERAILIENKSSNTGENIEFVQKLLLERGLDPKSILLVQRPYAERRVYATVTKHWPRKTLTLTSPPIPFRKYPTKDMPMETVIGILVGEIRKLRDYPKMGYQIAQTIPEEVQRAYGQLIELGYGKI
jgi:uncharacterized SAM-binding protein YcdF (DUF218 family)